MADYIVTFTPPTPNGGLHVGHLSGPYLSADVFSRARRILGDTVTFVSYSDDYQSYLERKAIQLKSTTADTSRRFHGEIEAALHRAQIEPDIFYQASKSQNFLEAVQLFRTLPDIEISSTESAVPFCPSCEKWGYEAYGRGICNNCGASTDHSQCETCAFPPDITGIRDVNCVICSEPMSFKTLNREHLHIDPAISNFCGVKHKARPPLKKYLESPFLSRALRWPIDRPGEYAIPVPTEKSGTTHTWFAGLAGYYAGTMSLDRAHLWSNDDCTWVAFAGFDCAFSHAVAYPYLLDRFGSSEKKYRLYTNAFLKLDGSDFSTSRGVAIWASDLLEIVESDYLRFYLAENAPEVQTANFDTKNFAGEIREFFGDLLPSVLEMLNESGGELLQDSEWVDYWNCQREHWLNTVHVDNFSMRACAMVIRDGLQKLVTRASTICRRDLSIGLAAWAALSMPLTPKLSRSIITSLGFKNSELEGWLRAEFLLSDLPATESRGFRLMGAIPSDEQMAELTRGI